VKRIFQGQPHLKSKRQTGKSRGRKVGCATELFVMMLLTGLTIDMAADYLDLCDVVTRSERP